MSQRFDTSDAPHITVARCARDLTVTGSDQHQVVVECHREKPNVERQGEALTITAKEDCVIHCPPGASITIRQVDGDLSAQGLAGPLAIESAGGDVTLRGVGPTTLREVSGDLEARGVEGELHVEEVRGDAKVRQVTGKVALESVRGDLAARDLGASAVVKHVGGDISLSTTLAAGASYRFEANGDISAKVEVGSGAHLALEASEIHCRLPLQVTERSSGRIVGTLGDGSAELILRAEGDLSVTEQGEGQGWEGSGQWESAMESWAQQFEAQMADMQHKLEERLANVPFVDSESVSRRAREAAERARRQAERAAGRARMRTERASHKHAQRGPNAQWTWAAPQPPKPPKPPAEPVSDAERMAILKMVQDKKITAEEAAQLLAALEGQG
jgi:hypothetical protein